MGPDASQNSRLLLKWAHNVAKGMEYLARRHIMHGDLAARNVLIGDNLVAKVSDFGLSKTFYDNIQYSKKERTEVPIKWMALEYLRYHNFTVTSRRMELRGRFLGDLFVRRRPVPWHRLEGPESRPGEGRTAFLSGSGPGRLVH